MTSGGSTLGRDIVLGALIISAVAHVGLMFWAKPRVMTHVAPGVVRTTKRGPVKITETFERPEPVAIDVFEDEKARKDAPEAEDGATLALPDFAEAAAAEKPRAEELPKPSAPELAADLKPSDAAPEMTTDPVPAASSVGRTAERMKFDETRIASVGGGEDLALLGYGASKTVASVPVFSPSAPALPAAAPDLAAALPAETFSREAKPKPAETAAAVPAEVMEKVDEKVVTAEKEAVKELLEQSDALDLAEAVSVKLAKSAAGGWTYFRATVTPKANLPAVPKDVVVLLDASGSIGNDRLASCRKAARRILRSATNGSDRFNLVAFRDRYSYCFRSWRDCDQQSFAAADRWLSNLAAHGRTDVFATISSVLTLPREATRPVIALVVTDGDANSGVADTAAILSKFSRLNDGLISVYMYGVKSSANAELIDVLTRGNRGESFIFDGWRWSAGEGIEGLSERFRDPLLTDFRVVFAADTPAEAYPTRLRNLYRGNRVEITGRVKGAPKEIAFSLRSLAGSLAYEGYFRLPLAGASDDPAVVTAFAAERTIDSKLH